MKIFAFYFIVFMLFFLFSKRKGDKINYKTIFFIPAGLALLIFVLSVVKIYFIYKIILLIIAIVMGYLSYWQWGNSIRNWFR